MTELWETPDPSEFELPGDAERFGPPSEGTTETAEQPEPVADNADPETVERPRNPDGTFAKAEEETDASDTAATEAPEGTETPAAVDEKLANVLTKFGIDPTQATETELKLARAYREGEELKGRQSGELSDLRALREQIEQYQAEVRQAAQPAQPVYDNDTVEQWVNENPAQVAAQATQAYNTGNRTLLAQLVAAWASTGDPAAEAFRWEVVKADMRTEQTQAQQAQQSAQQDWRTASTAFMDKHPDAKQHADKMLEIAPDYPEILSILQTGTETAKQQVLGFLYREAQARDADNRSTLNRNINAEAALAADKAIADAHVASSTTTVQAPKVSRADEIASEWDKERSPYDDGWNL